MGKREREAIKSVLDSHRKYTQQINGLNEAIRMLRLDIQTERDIEGVGMNGDSGGSGGSGISDPVSEAARVIIDRYEKNIRYYTQQIRGLNAGCLLVERLVGTLVGMDWQLAYYRYLKHMKWDEVEKKLNYERAQVFRMHNKVLEELSITLISDDQYDMIRPVYEAALEAGSTMSCQ
ncbi:MAG: hypothetical protein ACQ5SW_08335 [Sphaerochaetaceae bacterium]